MTILTVLFIWLLLGLIALVITRRVALKREHVWNHYIEFEPFFRSKILLFGGISLLVVLTALLKRWSDYRWDW